MAETLSVVYLPRHDDMTWTVMGQYTGVAAMGSVAGKYFPLNRGSLSPVSNEDLSRPVIRLWSDDDHVAA